MKPYTLILLFAFCLFALVGCVNKTYNENNTIKGETVYVKDTVEVKRLKAEIKIKDKDNYWLRKKLYAKVDTVLVHDTICVEPRKNAVQSRNAFPIVAEYNARTDNFPPKGTGKRYTEIRNKHNKEWENLPHRESEDKLFKPK